MRRMSGKFNDSDEARKSLHATTHPVLIIHGAIPRIGYYYAFRKSFGLSNDMKRSQIASQRLTNAQTIACCDHPVVADSRLLRQPDVRSGPAAAWRHAR